MIGIRYQILCSSKKTVDGERLITQIGGRNPLGEVWILKVEQAIEGIQSGSFEFFLNKDGQSFPIHIIETEFGYQIRTSDSQRNLILDLPDCPK